MEQGPFRTVVLMETGSEVVVCGIVDVIVRPVVAAR